MIVEALIEYPDPMDICKPPQIYIKEWKSIELIPMEWYRMLSNPHGYRYYRVYSVYTKGNESQ